MSTQDRFGDEPFLNSEPAPWIQKALQSKSPYASIFVQLLANEVKGPWVSVLDELLDGPSPCKEERVKRFIYTAAFAESYFLDKPYSYVSQEGSKQKKRLTHKGLWEKGSIRKKSGGTRIIHKPSPPLKEVLKHVQAVLGSSSQSLFEQCDWVTGANHAGRQSDRGGGSAIDNAGRHVRSKIIASFDIKDCYPSLTVDHLIRGIMQLKHLSMFGLGTYTDEFFPDVALRNRVKIPVDSGVATLISLLCTSNRKLPQGACTSPVLADLALLPVDKLILSRLHLMYAENQIQYSRYFDDITVSYSGRNRDHADFRRSVQRVISSVLNKNNLALNDKKVECTTAQNSTCEVTGFQIGLKKANFTKRTKKFLDREVWRFKKHGFLGNRALQSRKKVQLDVFVSSLKEIMRVRSDGSGVVDSGTWRANRKFVRGRVRSEIGSIVEDVIKNNDLSNDFVKSQFGLNFHSPIRVCKPFRLRLRVSGEIAHPFTKECLEVVELPYEAVNLESAGQGNLPGETASQWQTQSMSECKEQLRSYLDDYILNSDDLENTLVRSDRLDNFLDVDLRDGWRELSTIKRLFLPFIYQELSKQQVVRARFTITKNPETVSVYEMSGQRAYSLAALLLHSTDPESIRVVGPHGVVFEREHDSDTSLAIGVSDPTGMIVALARKTKDYREAFLRSTNEFFSRVTYFNYAIDRLATYGTPNSIRDMKSRLEDYRYSGTKSLSDLCTELSTQDSPSDTSDAGICRSDHEEEFVSIPKELHNLYTDITDEYLRPKMVERITNELDQLGLYSATSSARINKLASTFFSRPHVEQQNKSDLPIAWKEFASEFSFLPALNSDNSWTLFSLIADYSRLDEEPRKIFPNPKRIKLWSRGKRNPLGDEADLKVKDVPLFSGRWQDRLSSFLKWFAQNKHDLPSGIDQVSFDFDHLSKFLKRYEDFCVTPCQEDDLSDEIRKCATALYLIFCEKVSLKPPSEKPLSDSRDKINLNNMKNKIRSKLYGGFFEVLREMRNQEQHKRTTFEDQVREEQNSYLMGQLNSSEDVDVIHNLALVKVNQIRNQLGEAIFPKHGSDLALENMKPTSDLYSDMLSHADFASFIIRGMTIIRRQILRSSY